MLSWHNCSFRVNCCLFMGCRSWDTLLWLNLAICSSVSGAAPQQVPYGFHSVFISQQELAAQLPA